MYKLMAPKIMGMVVDDESRQTCAIDIAALTDTIAAYPVTLAVLFGSHARADAGEESDVDIAVAFDDSLTADQRLQQRIDLTTALMTTLKIDRVDVTDLDAVRPAVGKEAIETGQHLLGDQSTALAYRRRFESKLDDSETHEQRMQQFDALLDRLDARV